MRRKLELIAARRIAGWVRLVGAAAAVFAAILSASGSAKPLRVGMDLDGEPMTFVNAKGVPSGFAVDLVNAIAREMHLEVVFVAKPWAEMMDDFKAGRTDALANVTSTTERGTFIDFADPHMVMTAAVFVRRNGIAIRSPVDLMGRRIAVKPGSAPFVYLTEHGWNQHIVPTNTLRDSLRAVSEGLADAALDARIVGLKNIRDERLANVEAADVEFKDFAHRLHIGLHRGDAAHLELFNDGLARLRASGEYDRIYEKWIGPLEPGHLRFRDIQPYLPAAGVLLAAVAAAFVWQRRLLSRLARQARSLTESEERLTLVLEGTEDGFWDWDLASGRVERSKRWASMLGYEVGEVAPTFEAALDLVHPEDRASYEGFRDAVSAESGGRFDLQYRMRTKDGQWRWILGRGKIVGRNARGEPVRMAGTHTDITELKRTAEERESLRSKMLETQKLESLGILAGGIAHDFNNLLTVILANASLASLRSTGEGGVGEELAQIETAARSAADLCRQMLAYAGKGSFPVEQIDLNKLIAEIAHLLSVSISKKARFSTALASDLPPVDADASQLRQIVMNLVINASEALGDQAGEIRLRTWRGRPQPVPGAITHSFDLPAGECACLEVSDSGRGMDAATLARIFDPFFTTKFTGRGLGLAAVLGIVRARNGALTVSSAPERGTSFTLYLPAASQILTRAPAPVAAAERFQGGGTILVADDEQGVLSIVDNMLRRAGYQTVLATNGVEAIAKFEEKPDGFAAVILDLTMPGLDGAQVLRQLRAITPSTRALVMSGFSQQEVLNRLQDLGGVSILAKPFSPQALLAGLRQVLEGAAAV